MQLSNLGGTGAEVGEKTGNNTPHQTNVDTGQQEVPV